MIFMGMYITNAIYQKMYDSTALINSLIVLVCFQMIGGITDFYRSWRGVKISTELKIIIQNWTLSIVFTSGILSFLAGNDLEIEFFLLLVYYCKPFPYCQSFFHSGTNECY
ncbi:Colanic acid biosynthsis UDP-glucose lipid carrier transferase WcaJ [Klebsiella pneumoniae IS46]|nr:Colanic acid biosynthsis UDP-glucose lipid carrier transferase WcaJ [Klebsiella pneumoniae IS46]